MRENINILDKIAGYFVFVYLMFKSIFGYFLISYLLLDNWYDAMLIRWNPSKKRKLHARKNPINKTMFRKMVCALAGIDCHIINGRKIYVESKDEHAVLRYGSDYQLTNTITGIREQFVEDQYADVDVKGSVVLDIGASFGDSAIYFLLNGAKKVIALEPYPYTYKIAKSNISLNGFKDKAVLLNQACRSKPGSITIDAKFQNNDRNPLKYFKEGENIPVTTLGRLANKYGLNNAVLKIDCEGYEYEIIENADRKLLRRFKTIVLEYHYGYRSLERKLRNCGFMIRHSSPFYIGKIDEKRNVLCGFIYAERA